MRPTRTRNSGRPQRARNAGRKTPSTSPAPRKGGISRPQPRAATSGDQAPSATRHKCVCAPR